jgi:hypothetical protein
MKWDYWIKLYLELNKGNIKIGAGEGNRTLVSVKSMLN